MPIFRYWEDPSILHVRCIQPIYIGKNIYWAGLPYFFPITTDYIYWQRSDAWINSGEGNMQVPKLMEFGQWRKHIYLLIKKGELRKSFSIYSLCQSNKTPLNNELVIVQGRITDLLFDAPEPFPEIQSSEHHSGLERATPSSRVATIAPARCWVKTTTVRFITWTVQLSFNDLMHGSLAFYQALVEPACDFGSNIIASWAFWQRLSKVVQHSRSPEKSSLDSPCCRWTHKSWAHARRIEKASCN